MRTGTRAVLILLAAFLAVAVVWWFATRAPSEPTPPGPATSTGGEGEQAGAYSPPDSGGAPPAVAGQPPPTREPETAPPGSGENRRAGGPAPESQAGLDGSPAPETPAPDPGDAPGADRPFPAGEDESLPDAAHEGVEPAPLDPDPLAGDTPGAAEDPAPTPGEEPASKPSAPSPQPLQQQPARPGPVPARESAAGGRSVGEEPDGRLQDEGDEPLAGTEEEFEEEPAEDQDEEAGQEPEEGVSNVPVEEEEPPEEPAVLQIGTVRFKPDRVFDGEGTIVTVELSGPPLGLVDVTGALVSPSGVDMLGFLCSAPAGPGRWEGPRQIPSGSETGPWVVGWISVVDASGVDRTFQRGADDTTGWQELEVLQAASDRDPPQVLSIQIDPETVKQSEWFTVRVEASDDHSGPRVSWGYFRSPKSEDRLRFSAGAPDGGPPGFLETSVGVPKDADVGTWSVETLSVKDWAGKVKTYDASDPLLLGRGVLVEPVEGDTTKPELETIEIEPARVHAGEKVSIWIKAKDEESGVSMVEGSLGDAERVGLEVELPFRWVEDLDLFLAEIDLPADVLLGTWQVFWITLYDNAENSRTYEAGRDDKMEKAVFVVEE